jgi:lipopolysaccharide export system protein LptA
MVEVLNSDFASIETIENEMVKKLFGNVKLLHKGTLMYCDTATIYVNNNVFASGHIKIVRPKGQTISGQILNYYSDQKLAVIRDHIVLRDKKMKLETTDITYDMNTDVGFYTNGGVVTSEDTKITSRHGTYVSKSKSIFFKFDVRVTNPKYKLVSDTLEYNTETKRNIFYGSTKIENDSGYIWCNKGWHDGEKNQSSFGVGTIIYNGSQWLMTDSLFYDKKNGFGRIFKTFEFHDTTSKFHVFGDTAVYYEKEKRVIAYHRPILIYESSNSNPLFIRANIIESKEIDGHKTIVGIKNAKMYSKDFQAVSDTLKYFGKDSVFHLIKDPFAWNDSSQVSGRRMELYMKEKKPAKMIVYENAIMVQEEAKNKAYNQIAGDTIEIYFNQKGSKSQIEQMKANSNAKSIYYGKEEGKGYIGLNSTESSNLVAIFDSGSIKKIIFLDHPKATFYPIKDVNDQNSKLKNFIWKIALKPKNKEDL